MGEQLPSLPAHDNCLIDLTQGRVEPVQPGDFLFVLLPHDDVGPDGDILPWFPLLIHERHNGRLHPVK